MKIFLSAFLIMSIILLLVCCNQPKQSESKTKTIGVTLLARAHIFYRDLEEGLKTEAEKCGYELIITSADWYLGKQISQMEDFISRKVDAIIVCPVDSRGINFGVNEANQAGIPVFTADIAAEGSNVVAHIASDNFRDPKGQLVSPARLTLLYNGVLAQNDVALTGPTTWMVHLPYTSQADKLPLSLQDHGNPVRYRNIWVRELGGDAKQKEFTYSNELLDRYAGLYHVKPDLSLQISRKGRQLYMKLISPDSEHEHALFAESRTKFFAKEVDSSVAFQVNDQGTVESLDFYMAGDTNRARKVK